MNIINDKYEKNIKIIIYFFYVFIIFLLMLLLFLYLFGFKVLNDVFFLECKKDFGIDLV